MSEDEKVFDFSTMCRHCEKETTEPLLATVTGTVPEWVEGTFLYNGPALTRVGDAHYHHCFDSSAMLQKVTISSTGCWYMSRYLESNTLAKNLSAGTITVTEFGTAGQKTEQEKGFFSKMRQMIDPEKLLSDNAVMNVEKVAGKYYALGETPFMIEVDPHTLKRKERRSLYSEVGLVNQSSHPVRDTQGNSFMVGQSVGITGAKYCVVMFPVDGSAPRVVARVAPRWRMCPCYMHSMAITEHYLVMLEQPLAVSFKDVITEMNKSSPIIECVKWHNNTVLVHVLDMRTWKPVQQRFEVQTMFVLHFANCYEDKDGNVVMDFPSHDDASGLSEMKIGHLRALKGAEARASCLRFNHGFSRLVLPLASPSSAQVVSLPTRTLCTTPFENPVVNPKYYMRQHRYIYGTAHSPDGNNHSQITKLDVESGEVLTFFEEDLYAGDVIFISKPGAQAEDEGVLVVVCVVSGQPQLGCLVLLDSTTLVEVARVTYTPSATVPMPMHGMFVPATAEALT